MILMKADEVREKFFSEIKKEIEEKKLKLKLVAIIAGNDCASEIYVNSKKKDCEKLGISSEIIKFSSDTSEETIISKIKELNQAKDVTGILCQLPLPPHISEKKVIEAIDPLKDADCFHPYNVGKLFLGDPVIEPCTPKGIISLLDFYNIPIEGKRVVVVGRSNIVGKPVSIMLLKRNATVTICHSKTKNISSITKEADIVVVAVGKPHFLKADMVKDGCVVVDVGIHRIEDSSTEKGYKVIGDVDFDKVASKTYAITPVPGGVGIMTRVALMENILKLGLYNSGNIK